MEEQLRQQDRIAARCRLIEPQIEGFKVRIATSIRIRAGTRGDI